MLYPLPTWSHPLPLCNHLSVILFIKESWSGIDSGSDIALQYTSLNVILAESEIFA